MTQRPTALVRCSISDGMFDTEVAIDIDTVDGRVSLFADRALIEDGKALRAYVADEPERDARFVSLLLPSEAFETGSRWIRVAPEQVLLTCKTCGGTGKRYWWCDIDDGEFIRQMERCPDCREC